MGDASSDLIERCRRIEFLVLDVDGVLTDGVIAVDDLGVETKHFHVRDGSAIALWRRSGRRVAILSGRSARCVDLRAEELGISPVVQGQAEKGPPFRAMLAEAGVTPEQVCYVGDDLADLAPLRIAGLAACPADAATEVRAAAHLVASAPGGRGAVREIIDAILEHQSVRQSLLSRYYTSD